MTRFSYVLLAAAAAVACIYAILPPAAGSESFNRGRPWQVDSFVGALRAAGLEIRYHVLKPEDYSLKPDESSATILQMAGGDMNGYPFTVSFYGDTRTRSVFWKDGQGAEVYAKGDLFNTISYAADNAVVTVGLPYYHPEGHDFSQIEQAMLAIGSE